MLSTDMDISVGLLSESLLASFVCARDVLALLKSGS